ncbi:MAG: DinB family protein [Candidatus Solibacter usitatus]|nr:DinB family protein [Candidatus Solibacter usitatus]
MAGINDRTLLLAGLDEAFDRKSWHGANLRGSLRALSAAQAAWKPAPGRLSAWELALHCAYWKYGARRRLTGEKPGSFPLKGSNFFPLPSTPDQAAWKQALRLLADQHALLRAAVISLPAKILRTQAARKLIRGVAAHDLYHAGQIQLLKRLQPATPPPETP